MLIQIYDFIIEEVIEIDTDYIDKRYHLGNGRSYLENLDGVVYEVDDKVLDSFGIDFEEA